MTEHDLLTAADRICEEMFFSLLGLKTEPWIALGLFFL